MEFQSGGIPLTGVSSTAGEVIGDDELSRGTVAPRLRKSKKALEPIAVDALVATLRTANAERSPAPFA